MFYTGERDPAAATHLLPARRERVCGAGRVAPGFVAGASRQELCARRPARHVARFGALRREDAARAFLSNEEVLMILF